MRVNDLFDQFRINTCPFTAITHSEQQVPAVTVEEGADGNLTVDSQKIVAAFSSDSPLRN